MLINLNVCSCVVQNLEKRHNENRTKKYLQKVAKVKCLGKRLTYQNCLHKEIKYIKYDECLIPLSSSRLLTTNLNMKIHRTKLLSADSDGRTVWRIGLWLHACRDCRFESKAVSLLCLLSVTWLADSAMSLSLIHSPTECVSNCVWPINLNNEAAEARFRVLGHKNYYCLLFDMGVKLGLS